MPLPRGDERTTLVEQNVVPAAVAPFRVACAGLSDRGLVRSNNEDHFVIAELRKAMRVVQSNLEAPAVRYGDEQGHLFLVADGMGGHRAGQLASALAIGTIEQFVLNTFKWFDEADGTAPAEELPEALRQADQRVQAEAARRPELHGMGTTVTLAYTLDTHLYVLHAGDSRCYLLRGGRLHRLTRDHTLVGEMVRRGSLSEDEAAKHRWRHVIVNVVGGTEPGVEVEAHRVELHPGDAALLCSDGLSEMLAEDRIAEVLKEEADPQACCRRLVDEANAAGGRDNVTVIVARFEAV